MVRGGTLIETAVVAKREEESRSSYNKKYYQNIIG